MRKVIIKIPEAKKSNNSTHWIYSAQIRFVIDGVYLSYFISTTHWYLITMVNHFSKYGWAKIAKGKTANTILSSLKLFLYVSWKLRYYSLTMEKNLLIILLLIIYKANKIKFIHEKLFHPQSQGSIEAFNKYIQNALISTKDNQKEEFDLDETASDF